MTFWSTNVPEFREAVWRKTVYDDEGENYEYRLAELQSVWLH